MPGTICDDPDYPDPPKALQEFLQGFLKEIAAIAD
jgi:hypothetical protein